MAGKDTKKTVGTGIISEMDRYLFGEGTHYEIYNKLGAHPVTYRKKKGMYSVLFGYGMRFSDKIILLFRNLFPNIFKMIHGRVRK